MRNGSQYAADTRLLETEFDPRHGGYCTRAQRNPYDYTRSFFAPQTEPGIADLHNHWGSRSRDTYYRTGHEPQLAETGCQAGIRVERNYNSFFTRFTFVQREFKDVQTISHYQFPQNPVVLNRLFMLPESRQRILIGCPSTL